MTGRSNSGNRIKVFLSYSRRDLQAADALVSRLEAEDIEVLIDRRDLPYGEEWQGELADFIRSSDTVIWLLSPDSVKSRWVGWELAEVARIHKRLIPVRVRQVDPDLLPEALSRIHILPVEGVFDRDRHMEPLVTALKTDRAWAKEATRLADRARQWALKDRDRALLLQGRALVEAERWSSTKPALMPPIPGETLELILTSRRAAGQRQKRLAVGAVMLAAFGIGLAAFSWQQRNAALFNQSTYLSSLADEQIAGGDAGTGLQLAMLAVPHWPMALDRPLHRGSVRSLYSALLSLREARVLEGHGADVNTAEFSPDGRLVLTSSDDRTVKIWEAATGQTVREFGPHAGKVLSARYSPDGRFIVTFTEDSLVYLWVANSGAAAGKLTGHTGRITDVAFSRSGRLLASASDDGTARVWALDTPASSMVLPGNQGAITSVEFSPDEASLLTISKDQSPTVWDLSSGTPRAKLLGHSASVAGAAFAPSGTRIATISLDGTARIFDAALGSLLAVLAGPSGALSTVTFCQRDDCVVTTGRDGSARIWDTKTGELRFELSGHSAPITAASVGPSGKWLATAGRDGAAIVWSLEQGTKLLALRGHSSDIFDLSFDPSEQLLVTASRDRTARIWRIPTTAVTSARTNLAAGIRSAAVSQDRKLLAAGASNGTISLLDGTTLAQLGQVPSGGAAVTYISFDKPGKRLLAGYEDGSIRVYALPMLQKTFEGTTDGSEIGGSAFHESGDGYTVVTVSGSKAVRRLEKLEISQPFAGKTGAETLVVAIPPSQDRVVIGDLNGEIAVVDWTTGQRLVGHEGHRGAIMQAAFDPLSSRVVTGSEDGTARIWNLDTGALVQLLKGHDAPVTSVAVSGAGTLIATGSADRTVRLWRIGEANPIAVYPGHLSDITFIRFLDGESTLVSGSDDGDIHRWTAAPNFADTLQSAIDRSPRCLSKEQQLHFGLSAGEASWCKSGNTLSGGATNAW